MRPLRSPKHKLLVAGVLLLISQTAVLADSPRETKSKPAQKPVAISSAQFLYQSFLGEIAAQRGATSAAIGTYLDLTRKTSDPRIARRATELALQAREMVLAAEAARLWLDIEPDSQTALQTLTAITSESNQKPEELELSLKNQLERQVAKRPAILLQLPQLFSRYTNVQSNRQAINRLTDPYLKLAEARYVRGIAAALAQDIKTALNETNAALSARPDWEDAALLRWRLTPAEQRAEAAEALRLFGEKHPKAADARLAHARWLAAEKRTAEAIKAANALLHDIPDNADLRYATTIVLVEAGDWPGAETQIRKLLDQGYHDTDLLKLQLGQIVEEQSRYGEALALYAEVPAGRHFVAANEREARLLFRLGKLEEAQKVLHEAAQTQPNETIQLQLIEADLLRQGGRPEEAFGILELALVAEPENIEALYMSALIAEPLKRFDVMEQRLRQVIQLKPDYAQAYNALGYSLVDRNIRVNEAAPLLEKALKLAPDDAAILDSVAWLRFRQGDLKAALALIQRAMQLMDDTEVRAHHVEILWASGQFDDARKAYREALEKAPSSHLLDSLKLRLGF